MKTIMLIMAILACLRPSLPAASFKPTRQSQIVPAKAEVALLWQGGEFTEGPALAPDGAIWFSDIGNTIHRFDPQTGKVTLVKKNSGKSNGLMFDAQGGLVACEGANGGNRRISVTAPGGSIKSLADRWQGKRFNSPNDLFIVPNGNIYFTDPRYVGDEPRDLDFEGVFLIRPNGEVILATRDVKKPNGILISRNGRKLYLAAHEVTDKGTRQLVSFKIQTDGTLKEKKVLHDFGMERGIDGMTLGKDNNLYATAGSGPKAGIYVFGPAGQHLAFIPLPGDPTNCIFGKGQHHQTLFITAQAPLPDNENEKRTYGLYAIRLK